MARSASFDVARTVDGVEIYVDLAHLPDAEAIKKSRTRLANKRAAEKRKEGTSTPRGPRSAPSASKFSYSAEVPRMPETEALRARHAQEIAEHRAAGEAMTKRHEEDAANVQRLTVLITEITKLPNGDKLSAPFLKELANLK